MRFLLSIGVLVAAVSTPDAHAERASLGTYTGVSKARIKLLRGQKRGFHSSQRTTIALFRDGDLVTVESTAHDVGAPGNDVTTTTSGRVVDEGPNHRGDPLLVVQTVGDDAARDAAAAVNRRQMARATAKGRAAKGSLAVRSAEKSEVLRFRSDRGLDRLTHSRARIRATAAAFGVPAWLVNLALRRDVTARATETFDRVD